MGRPGEALQPGRLTRGSLAGRPFPGPPPGAPGCRRVRGDGGRGRLSHGGAAGLGKPGPLPRAHWRHGGRRLVPLRGAGPRSGQGKPCRAQGCEAEPGRGHGRPGVQGRGAWGGRFHQTKHRGEERDFSPAEAAAHSWAGAAGQAAPVALPSGSAGRARGPDEVPAVHSLGRCGRGSRGDLPHCLLGANWGW